ncbi:DoxX family membrane protein [Pyxidicoccus fallax]|uniref:DoxX family membrane protein n=1 Tax=Pyxidicoccus fallax TaxID=394095 RepID=A0A848LE39_9BACT|nr:DoxX family membrane protein [Pyxidicoccus fallax]NMO16472.1 DoxX family membrane protein [Pyxidicoccus fallax]NPC84243.1 DoxX family membrane protein [Pyxidicoccus fallax]
MSLQTPAPHDAAASHARDRQLAHAVLRLVLGVNITLHGLVRVGAPGAFADTLVKNFAETPLPEWSVRAFALSVPFVELIVGLCILLGLRLRLALVVGGAFMASLTFGESLRQQWSTVSIHLSYALVYFVLLSRVSDARFTLDGLLGSRRTAP